MLAYTTNTLIVTKMSASEAVDHAIDYFLKSRLDRRNFEGEFMMGAMAVLMTDDGLVYLSYLLV